VSEDLEAVVRQLDELNRIGAALSAERDTARLLELILQGARAITSSEAGSLYLVEPPEGTAPGDEDAPRGLRFAVAQNDAVDLPFRSSVLSISERSIAGHVALTGRPVRLDDAYAPPAGVPYSFDRSFDRSAGYRTRSVLAVPMRTPQGAVLGVVQLINSVVDGVVRPYSARQEALALSLASQAAIALENSRLYEEIRRLFEGFVRASVIAIEERDPATSGHSFRVANLTVAFAEAVDRADSGPFAGVRFSREDMRTLRYASLLHDFGKVGVREEVLVKAKKLYPPQLELVRERFKLARRSREVALMQQRLDYLLRHGREAYVERLPDLEAAYLGELERLDQALAAVEAANEPSVMPDGSFDRLNEIAAMTFTDADGTTRSLLQENEVRLLSLRKGSLSEAERVQIESHVVHSYRFLSQIPWTREIRRIPALAVGHHEKLNGTGYPNRLSAADIPVQTRMMTISDIFDALSAADRPYKKAVPVERALHILGLAVEDGEIDPLLFEMFVDARVFDRWEVEAYPY
jgi:HD-GYP domain-containing protein (c-di-GMP phosphodiesterase class II)